MTTKFRKKKKKKYIYIGKKITDLSCLLWLQQLTVYLFTVVVTVPNYWNIEIRVFRII